MINQVPTALIPLDRRTVDGVKWMQFHYDGTYQAYKDMPNVLETNGMYFKKMSHNSDTFTVSYKHIPKYEVVVVA